MPEEEGEDHGFDLLMPFVLVQSNGGTLDDESFCIGWECGRIDGMLLTGETDFDTGTVLIHAISLPQVDLIAMRHGYVVTQVQDTTPCEHGFLRLQLTKVQPDARPPTP